MITPEERARIIRHLSTYGGRAGLDLAEKLDRASDAEAPRLSDAARAALGPEHVVVTPHRNGASYR